VHRGEPAGVFAQRGRRAAGRLAAMTEPARDPDEHVNLHPGQYDEGGEGGMATRELAAREQAERAGEDDGT
jgi:hypothetical protein